jgi:hypothetical protein
MKENLKKLHAQRKIWKPHGRTSLCWIFYCVNDNAKVDLINTQIMRHILCYKRPIIGINPRMQARKGMNSYYKTNGITSLKIHVDTNHSFIAQMFEEDVNNILKRLVEIQPSKKRKNPFGGSNSKFVFVKNTLKKDVS